MKLTDEKYMARCIQLAKNGRINATPNPMVGAVIVWNDRIIGEGYHVRCGEGHAEVNAVRSLQKMALDELRNALHTEPSAEQLTNWIDEHCRQATIYVSLEPCAHFGKTPPCADLLASLHFKRCVIGCKDTFAKVAGKGIEKLKEAGIEVEVGVLEEECRELNRKFFTFHAQHRPYILLKWAQSSDGYLDALRETADQPPVILSTPLTQMAVHKLRSEYDAILVGSNTERLDKPSLTTRYWYGRNPQRIILHREPLPELLNRLYQQGIQSLMVEGGAFTLNRFIEQRLWDEIQIEQSNKTIGTGVSAPSLPAQSLRYHETLFGVNYLRLFPKKGSK